MHAFIFGLIPMTLIQYYYWDWMTKSWTNEIDGPSVPEEFLVMPIMITLIYCVYESLLYSRCFLLIQHFVIEYRWPSCGFWKV